MSQTNRWLLPDGVDELLPGQASRLESVRRSVLDQYHAWGYDLVFPPLIEYRESLLTATGRDLSDQTFTLTDQLTGRLMAVRADITPQVARIDAHRLKSDQATRLCYCGSVLRARPENLLAKRTLVQTGAELYGHVGLASDFEILTLMLNTLQITGCTQIRLDLGHMAIIEAVLEQIPLTSEQKAELLDIYQRKSQPELEFFAKAFKARDQQLLMDFMQLHGGLQVLAKARRVLAAVPAALNALDLLETLAQKLGAFIDSQQLYFDLAELRGFHYHTGLVFAAYAPGAAGAIAKGGRYDKIGEIFGRARPATGFSLDLLQLVELSQAKTLSVQAIYAPDESDSELETLVRQLRDSGERVVRALSLHETPADLGCDRQIVRTPQGWKIELLN